MRQNNDSASYTATGQSIAVRPSSNRQRAVETPYSIAYSPCPNDTYIFAALANEMLPDVPRIRVEFEDIENLNKSAEQSTYEFTKVSFGAIPLLMENYRILRAGGGIGRGCGPLLVARPGTGTKLEDFRDKLIAIPGERTTAFMLLQLALGGRPPILRLRFDQIVDAVVNGTMDAGLIIHESRFTYEKAGLVNIIDLGEWWESTTNLPIPLGAVIARNDVTDDEAHRVQDAIRASLTYARNHESEIMPYVRQHASEMSDDVMRKHIALYVNEYTDDIGETGIAAVKELFRRANAAGIIPQATDPRFLA